MATKTTLRLDQGAVNRMLKGRGGEVSNTMRGFAGLVTRETKAVARSEVQRRTGEYESGIHTRFRAPTEFELRAEAPYSMIIEKGSRPHVITPKSAQVLRFVASSGAVVFTQRVNHPGTRPYRVLEKGVEKAARRFS